MHAYNKLVFYLLYYCFLGRFHINENSQPQKDTCAY